MLAEQGFNFNTLGESNSDGHVAMRFFLVLIKLYLRERSIAAAIKLGSKFLAERELEHILLDNLYPTFEKIYIKACPAA